MALLEETGTEEEKPDSSGSRPRTRLFMEQNKNGWLGSKRGYVALLDLYLKIAPSRNFGKPLYTRPVWARALRNCPVDNFSEEPDSGEECERRSGGLNGSPAVYSIRRSAFLSNLNIKINLCI